MLDTPIVTDDRSLKKVLGQKQPAVVVLYDGRENDKPLHSAIKSLAKKNAGELLVVKIDIAQNPETHERYDNLETPALISMNKAFFGRKIKSQAENIRPSDLRAHADHLLNDTPLPEERPNNDKSKASGHAKQITDRNFRKEVLNSNVPVLVDFFAVWCGPCQTIAPFIDRMAGEYKGKVKVVKLNTDANPRTASEYGIRSIPTFMVFKNGQPAGRFSGASPQKIEQMIQQAIN